MSNIKKTTQALIDFRNARDWAQFHNPKDLAIAISIEAAELNEIYLWKETDELDTVDKNRIKEELADVFAYGLLLAEHYNFDVLNIIQDKIAKNEKKYPVEKSKGKSTKYDQL